MPIHLLHGEQHIGARNFVSYNLCSKVFAYRGCLHAYFHLGYGITIHLGMEQCMVGSYTPTIYYSFTLSSFACMYSPVLTLVVYLRPTHNVFLVLKGILVPNPSHHFYRQQDYVLRDIGYCFNNSFGTLSTRLYVRNLATVLEDLPNPIQRAMFGYSNSSIDLSTLMGLWRASTALDITVKLTFTSCFLASSPASGECFSQYFYYFDLSQQYLQSACVATDNMI